MKSTVSEMNFIKTIYCFIFVSSEIGSVLNKFEPTTSTESIMISKAVAKALELADISEIAVFFDENTSREIISFDILTEQCVVSLAKLSAKINPFFLSSLFLFENQSSLYSHVDFLSSFSSKSHIFVIFKNNHQLNFKKLFQTFLNSNIININVIVPNDALTINLITFLPFTNGDCRNVTPKIINTFTTTNSSWMKREFFNNKINNLHGCPVTLATYDYAPAIITEKFNDSELISGHDIDLLRGVSEMLDFTLDIQIVTGPAAWGFITENGTSGGVMKKILDKEADIAIGSFYLTLTRAKFMSFSQYHFSSVILVIPPGQPFSPIEKFYSPFRFTTWIALVNFKIDFLDFLYLPKIFLADNFCVRCVSDFCDSASEESCSVLCVWVKHRESLSKYVGYFTQRFAICTTEAKLCQVFVNDFHPLLYHHPYAVPSWTFPIFTN